MCSFLIILLSYSVFGWSFRGGPGLLPFLCLSVHTFQSGRGSAGNILLSGLVNMIYIMFTYTVHVSKCGLVNMYFLLQNIGNYMIDT